MLNNTDYEIAKEVQHLINEFSKVLSILQSSSETISNQVHASHLDSSLEEEGMTKKGLVEFFVTKFELVNDQENISPNVSSVLTSLPPVKKAKFEMLDDIEGYEIEEVLSFETEIQKYQFFASPFPRKNDILEFWKNNQKELPTLFKIPRAKMIPARVHKTLFINANYNALKSSIENMKI